MLRRTRKKKWRRGALLGSPPEGDPQAEVRKTSPPPSPGIPPPGLGSELVPLAALRGRPASLGEGTSFSFLKTWFISYPLPSCYATLQHRGGGGI